MATQSKKAAAMPKNEKVEPETPQSEEEPRRGRKKGREEDDLSDEGAPKSGERKRKRSRKTLDKKYLCPQEGCGKTYSRAEHLYRHQLNHTPKQIYHCDFPDCGRQFVRQDLCVRHRERHTTKGSNLQRKDNYITQALAEQNSKTPTIKVATAQDAASNPYSQATYDSSAIMHSPTEPMGPPRHDSNGNEVYRMNNFNPTSEPYRNLTGLHRSNSDSQYYGDSPGTQLSRSNTVPYPTHQRPGSFGSVDGTIYQRSATILPVSEGSSSETIQWNGTSGLGSMPTRNQNTLYQPYPQQYNSSPTISSMYAQTQQNNNYPIQQYYNTGNDYMNRNLSSADMIGGTSSEAPVHDISYPIFDDDTYGRSPAMLPEAFAEWLLSQPQPIGHQGQRDPNELVLDPSLQMSLTPFPNMPPQTSMSVNSLLEPTSRIASISESKRQQVLELISKRFNEAENSPIAKQRESLLAGDWDAEGHVLSRQSFQTYIGSYWYHFHDQMPILHRPTFSADKSQNLLLIAVLAIGAANLDKMYGQTVTAAAADFANFLAWHLRGKVFEDKDFPPPTKLWILQTLILLECYEKLYSSRSLHERSTIHHATSISLLRRGSALLGRSAMDSPPVEEDKQNTSDVSDPWWNHWITNEATKRVVYALFIIDSTHTIMFGHTAVMLAHELRLALPCDEALWTANSGMEVGRLEQSLRNQGIKQIMFLDGLKSTLNGSPVRATRFGRTALMAGLLNVTFHLGQRDQIRLIGGIGGKEPTWRSSLTKAFDIWEKDWDNDHEPPTILASKNRHVRDSSHSSTYSSSTVDEEHTFESRVVLHHLAHMAMHVDVVQCQVYARAKRLLGRTVTSNDYQTCSKRMKEWAGKASARDAVYYSLKFLTAVLTPDISQAGSQQKPPPFRSSIGEYVPRDDYLLNRPWVVYFAALIVWSYGYALDGPLKASAMPSIETKEEQIADMRSFLSRVGAVTQPNALVDLVGQRNNCTGMLRFLGTQFRRSRWELMHEASILLGNCVDMLRGKDPISGIV